MAGGMQRRRWRWEEEAEKMRFGRGVVNKRGCGGDEEEKEKRRGGEEEHWRREEEVGGDEMFLLKAGCR